MATQSGKSLPRPLIGAALTCLAGTWLGLSLDLSLPLLFFGALAALGLATAAAGAERFRRGRPEGPGRLRTLASISLHLCILCTAWARASEWQESHRVRLALPDGQEFRLRGFVAEDPFVREEKQGTGRVGSFPLAISLVQGGAGEWQKANGTVRVFWHGWKAGRSPAYGQYWEVRGRPRAVSRPALAPGSEARLPRMRGPGYVLHTGYDPGCRLAEARGWDRLVQRCYEGRAAVAGYLAIGIEDFPVTVGLLQAILLGQRQLLTPGAYQAFVATGTLHVFAVSGGHVAMLALLLAFVFQVLRVSRVYWGLGIVPILIVYTLAIGAPASAVRACIMGVIYFSAPFLDRKPDVLTALAASAVLIVAVSPDQMFDLGFILSFGVVLGLILLYPHFERPLRRLWQPDPFRLQPEPRAVRLARRAGRHLATLTAMSCAAWLVSTPLMSYFFGQFSPVAVVSNIVVVPLAFFVMLGGSLSLLAGGCVPVLADVFNHANLVLVGSMVKAAEVLGAVPGGYFTGLYMPGWLAVLWYAVLGGAILWLRGARRAGDRPADGDAGAAEQAAREEL